MNKYIIIRVTHDIKRFINKCNSYNIELYNIKYIDKDNIIVKIKKDDFDNIRIDYYIYKINKLKYFILCFVIMIICMFLVSNIILKINVIHSNKKVRELVYSELYDNGIKIFSIKKDFNKLENIKNKILENNRDKLEWISITNIGMKYVVRVEERIIDNIKEAIVIPAKYYKEK